MPNHRRKWMMLVFSVTLLIGMLGVQAAEAATAYIPSRISVAASSPSPNVPVAWTASATAGASYELQMSFNGGAYGANIYSGGGTSYTVPNLVSGSYTFRVRAVKDGFTPSNWRVSSACVVSLKAGIPSAISVSPTITNDYIPVAWGTSTTPSVAYELEADSGSGFVNVYTGSETKYTLPVAASGTYTFRVRATRVGYAPSDWRTSAPCVVTLAVAIPTAFNAPTTAAGGYFPVGWGASVTSGAQYELEMDNGTGFAGVYAGPELQYMFGELAIGTYTFRVRATKPGYTPSNWLVSPPCVVSAPTAGGVKVCKYCHDGFPSYNEWRFSTHANTNSTPDLNYGGNDPALCGACHNALNDGELMPATEGTAARPIVSCEACHGPSLQHGGIPEKVTYRWPDLEQCATCHEGHASEVVAKVTASRHNQAGHDTSSKCQRCHTTQGSVQFAAYTGDKTVMDTLTLPALPVEQRHAPTCSACHDAHTNNLRVVSGWDPNANGQPDEFDLCTSCHTLQKADGTIVASGNNGTAPYYHNTRWYRVIATTHYDNPATATTAGGTSVEGYVVRKDSTNPCFDCHGHELKTDTRPDRNSTTVHRDWAQSAHGGHLLTQKLAAADANAGDNGTAAEVDVVMAAATTDASAPAWTHYNWDQSSSRGACQRCHTATGAANFMNNPATYNFNNNNFSHLSGWTAAAGSPQQEMLYCWGCHSDSGNGVLRDPGAITENYTAATAGGPVVTVNYPNINQSNVCMVCHLGREVGGNIATDIDADGVRSFINSHYLTAGANLFNESGYEYSGQSYASFGYHKNIGVADTQGTGSAGPCVTCHMSGDQSHTWVFVEKDGTGAITANQSTLCTTCHASMGAAQLEASKESFDAALAQLKTALDAKGIYFSNAHPYFYAGPNGTGGAFTNWAGVYGLASWKNVMGAAFNYNLLVHDPGAFAHNRGYALKLIADSIDFIQDGAIDADASLASQALARGVNVGEVDASGTALHANAPLVASPVYCGACHAQAPHYGGNATNIPQYLFTGQSCASCHNSNNIGDNWQVLEQYVTSPHGDVAGVWTHEEVNTSSTTTGRCQRCHTTRGFVQDLTVGDNGITFGASDVLEVLACNACHSSVDPLNPTRRPAGAYTATWTANNVTATMTFANAGDSNICIRCHSARRAGANITPLATTTAHYFPAATTVFGGTANAVNVSANTNTAPNNVPAVGTKFTGGGYEFAGQSYSGLGVHKQIGMANYLNTGTSGPCVACHMSGGAGHSWHAVSKNETTGAITAINSTVCASCHENMTASKLNSDKTAFAAALDELKALLNARSIYFNPANGSFYREATFTTTVNNAYYATQAALAPAVSTIDLQGAAYNYWLFTYEGADPAAYVHNREYALELVADSIDLLGDGLIDNDVNGARTLLAGSIDFQHAQTNVVAAASATVCGQCHAQAPHYGGAALVQAQYVAPATTRYTVSCADCHTGGTIAHPSTLINQQYAESGHGDVAGDPWLHYDWRASSRSSCARCHNATAFVAKLGIETNTTWLYTAADTNKANETLRCTACHTDIGTGAVRTPGAYTETYTDGTTQAFPDVGKSNLCMRCHSGRESGGSVKILLEEDANNNGVWDAGEDLAGGTASKLDDLSTKSFVNSHYLTAGGTIFTTTGYEFTGQDYSNLAFYAHDDVGIAVPGSPAASDAGPCAGCHMGTGTADHTWDVVTKDAGGVITAINSNTCATCHTGGFALTPAGLEEEAEGMAAALEVLRLALNGTGLYFYNASPYFFTAPYTLGYTESGACTNNLPVMNWQAGGSTTFAWNGSNCTSNSTVNAPGTDGTGKNRMGAAFNYNLLVHDPGAFAHNSHYAKLLIFDSLDFLDNGVLDGTIDLTGNTAAADYLKPGYINIAAVARP